MCLQAVLMQQLPWQHARTKICILLYSLCAFWAYTGTILRVKSEKFCSDAAKVPVLLDSGVHVPNLPIVFRISSSSSSCVRLTYFCSGFAIAVWLPTATVGTSSTCMQLQYIYSCTTRVLNFSTAVDAGLAAPHAPCTGT